MATPTVENYLKQLYVEQQADPGKLVPMGKLAAAMKVVPGTATSMVKALADSGLVDYEPRLGAKLTAGGRQLALHVLRRHRLVELFLVNVLEMDWTEVHAEAEELEHAISDKVLERIDALLGHPSVDPHGDPIPSAGKLAVRGERETRTSLMECEIDRPLRIVRVMDQNVEFLQFIERCGLTPGTHVTVIARDPQAAAVTVQPRKRKPVTLGSDAAGKLMTTRG